MSCPNCNRSFRAGGNGLAFHLTWCKPALPEPQPLGTIYVPTAAAMTDDGIGTYGTNTLRPVVARAPRGRLLTRKARRARLHELLARPAVQQKAPAVRKAAGPKLPASTGKHARCVAHVPMTRTAPGLAFACFDVAPDADAIAERAEFVAAVDASWSAHHAAFIASQMAGDGLVPFRYAETAEDARADRWIDTRVPGWRAGFNSAGTYRPAKDRPAAVFVPTENSNNPRELLAA